MFGYLLSQLIQILNENSKISYENRALVMDNSVIRKSSIFKAWSQEKTKYYVIPPYEPLLNPAEKIILTIKIKLRMRQPKGHVLSLAAVKSVVNELVNVNMKKIITSSLSEALNKMKVQCLK